MHNPWNAGAQGTRSPAAVYVTLLLCPVALAVPEGFTRSSSIAYQNAIPIGELILARLNIR